MLGWTLTPRSHIISDRSRQLILYLQYQRTHSRTNSAGKRRRLNKDNRTAPRFAALDYTVKVTATVRDRKPTGVYEDGGGTRIASTHGLILAPSGAGAIHPIVWEQFFSPRFGFAVAGPWCL